jgi:hypothetical protein
LISRKSWWFGWRRGGGAGGVEGGGEREREEEWTETAQSILRGFLPSQRRSGRHLFFPHFLRGVDSGTEKWDRLVRANPPAVTRDVSSILDRFVGAGFGLGNNYRGPDTRRTSPRFRLILITLAMKVRFVGIVGGKEWGGGE